MRRVFVKIYGSVQGVFFRSFIQENANALNLVGWVRNANDDTVEAIFEGQGQALKKIIELCRQGPPSAAVEKVEEQWGEVKGEFRDFVVEY